MLVGANSLGVCVPVGRLPPRPSVAAPLSHPGLYVASVEFLDREPYSTRMGAAKP